LHKPQNYARGNRPLLPQSNLTGTKKAECCYSAFSV
jgi:hypothetical protein